MYFILGIAIGIYMTTCLYRYGIATNFDTRDISLSWNAYNKYKWKYILFNKRDK